jgi:hypothetical protein
VKTTLVGLQLITVCASPPRVTDPGDAEKVPHAVTQAPSGALTRSV